MSEPLKLGIAGLGTIGTGVVKLIQTHGDTIAAKCGRAVEIVAVCDLDRNKDRGVDLSAMTWYGDAVELARCDEIDVFIELIGGEGGIAKASVEAALNAGKHVVTANKAMLAHHGTELAKLAEEKGVALNFEAAVAGGIPIVKTIRESLVSNEIWRVWGILNGTCNYILTQMEREGREFGDVLKEAQDKGYAEADPTADIGGFDTAHKLAILTSLVFGTEIDFDSIYLEGIEGITPADLEAAEELGYRIKLLGVALKTDTGIEQRVHPTMIPRDSAIAGVDGAFNAVAVDGDFVGDVLLVGLGAGERPTATSVVADIVDIARGIVLSPFATPAKALKPYTPARMRAHEGGYYVRLSVHDQPGAFAAIAMRMAEQGISLESIVQKRPEMDEETGGNSPRLIVMITHETTEAAIREAFKTIEQDGHIAEKPQMIRIEEL